MSEELKCKATVYSGGTAFNRGHRCTRKAWKDGYCKQHHPESVKKRQEENDRKWREKQRKTPLALAKKTIEKQAAEIQSLKQQLAEQEWVSVEDRLPSKNGYYQVWCESPLSYQQNSYTQYFDVAVMMFNDGVGHDTITHWKPITPPKEE